MYEPTQRRVIDFYAELVRPLLELAPGQVDDLRQVVTTVTPGEYWGEDNLAVLPATYTLITYRVLLRRTVERLFDHATGHRLVDGLGDLIGYAPSLEMKPGVLLLSPQIMWVVADDPRARLLAPSLPLAYDITRPIVLFSGQHLIGAGAKPTHQALQAGSLLSRPFRMPLLRVRRLDMNDPEPTIAVTTAEGAEGVVVRDISIAQDNVFPSYAVDLSKARRSWVSGLSVHTCEVGVQINPEQNTADLHWIESSDLRCTTPVRFGPKALDGTVWSAHCSGGGDGMSPATLLEGINGQLWFGSVEPSAQEEPIPEIHEIDLGGTGSGVFACHIEGQLRPSKDAVDAEQSRSPIRIRTGSEYTHVAACFITLEGFPVLIERDAVAAWVRQPVGARTTNQPLFNAGLTNLLLNSTFVKASQGSPKPSWVPWPGARYSVERQMVRGWSTALRIVMPRGLGGRGQSPALRQKVFPGAERPVPSVADRSFAAGCWIFDEGRPAGEIRLTLNDGQGQQASSVTHSGLAKWEFVSVSLHTGSEARMVECAVIAGDGAQFLISEPMLVEGLFLPPFHPGPASEAHAALVGPALPARPVEEIGFELGPVGQELSKPLQRRVVGEGGLLYDVLVVCHGLPKNTRVHIQLRCECDSQVWWLLSDPMVIDAVGLGWRRVENQPFVPSGSRVTLHTELVRGSSEGKDSRPFATEPPRLAVTIRLKREV